MIKSNSAGLPVFVRFLQVVRTCYQESSGNTQQNFSRLGKALLFTVLICGSVLAASFCEFWLNKDYRFMPLVFIGTSLFYYILDQSIIMGDNKRSFTGHKRLRIVIALILGLFNSFLIDYYFFRTDILTAREKEIIESRQEVSDRYASIVNEKERQKTMLYKDIDKLENRLSAQLDSLNAEANGIGGSRKKGVAAIWVTKYKNYQADSMRVTALISTKQNEIAALNMATSEIKKDCDREMAGVSLTISQGINKSLELLHKIIWLEGSFTNIFMSILILLVSMLMELVPLIVKGFYDIEEYFEIVKDQKETMLANSHLRKQNNISREAALLIQTNSREMAEHGSNCKVQLMTNDLEHSKKVMQVTENFMDEMEAANTRWLQKYPSLYVTYGKPVIEKAYQTLAVATEKAYS